MVSAWPLNDGGRCGVWIILIIMRYCGGGILLDHGDSAAADSLKFDPEEVADLTVG